MPINWLSSIWEDQRPHLILWGPVFMAVGVGLYFSLPFEPQSAVIIALAAVGLTSITLAIGGFGLRRIILLALFFLTLGYLAAVYRSYSVAAPIQGFRFYGTVEGRVIGISRSASSAPRLTLDRVRMDGVRRVPETVRVSMFGFIPEGVLQTGARVTMVANMSPPGSPVEPGGFDFRRMAWFDRLGAVGYTRNPVLEMRPYMDNGLWLGRLRMAISTGVYDSIGGQNGAFAGAILTGDRSRIDPDVLGTLRASNLAHLLAISGLHMGLLTGFIYMLVRYGLALAPPLALRVPVKKIGAGFALLAGFSYLLLSGSNVATQRAFIMVAVVLIAVMLDRPAFTLRAVALAAFIVLLIRPESLTEAGFQMSFAATTALIGVFEDLRRLAWWRALQYGRLKRLMPVLIILVTSAVAGVATAPFSAFHFNQLSNYGLAANLLSVPMMGLLVMPAAVVAGLLVPLGLEGPALWLMGQGIGWILGVAGFFSSLDGALTYIPTGRPVVLPMIGLAGCLLFLLRGPVRISGVALFVVAVHLWSNSPRPLLLVNDNGALIGVMTEQGRVLNKDSAYRFAAGVWLENDGDSALQEQAFLRTGLTYSGKQVFAPLENGWTAILDRSKPVENAECAARQIIIAPKWEDAPTGPCLFIGSVELAQNRGFAVVFENGAPLIIPSAPAYPARPWNSDGAPYQ